MTILYTYRVRDERTRKWRQAKYKMTPEHAKAFYGERNYELVAGSEVVYRDDDDPMRNGAAQLQSTPGYRLDGDQPA